VEVPLMDIATGTDVNEVEASLRAEIARLELSAATFAAEVANERSDTRAAASEGASTNAADIQDITDAIATVQGELAGVSDSGTALEGRMNTLGDTVTLLEECVSNGQVLVDGECQNPPLLTETSLSECNADNVGKIRSNSDEGVLEVCAGAGEVFLWRMLISLAASDGSSQAAAGESCKQLMEDGAEENGVYWVKVSDDADAFETYCDMTTAGGGWTLVSSVHEGDIRCKCCSDDRWSSTNGNGGGNGAGNWQSDSTFGQLTRATSDDYKNKGYSSMQARDLMVWHVPNNTPLSQWKARRFIGQHTTNGFMSSTGNLKGLFDGTPGIRYDGRSCRGNALGSVTAPTTFDQGSGGQLHGLTCPNCRGETSPGHFTFRVVNWECGVLAFCPFSVRGRNSEHYCMGTGGHMPEGGGQQCGDYSGWDWWHCPYCHSSWAASAQLTQATTMFFYN